MATPAVAMIDMADAVVPVFVPAVSAETIDPAPHGTNQSALDDRAGAQRAGAGHYGTRVIDR